MVPLVPQLIFSIISWGGKHPHFTDKEMEEQKDKGICPRFPRLVIDQARIHLIIKSSYLILHSLGSSLWCTACRVKFYISRDLCITQRLILQGHERNLLFYSTVSFMVFDKAPQEYFPTRNLLILFSCTLAQNPGSKVKGVWSFWGQ